jgi:hypothetical protein
MKLSTLILISFCSFASADDIGMYDQDGNYSYGEVD